MPTTNSSACTGWARRSTIRWWARTSSTGAAASMLLSAHETLLAYLVRRLLENGANSSFVNQLVDPAVSIDQLVADPPGSGEVGGLPHEEIPLPARPVRCRSPQREEHRPRQRARPGVQARLADSERVNHAAGPLLGDGTRGPATAPVRNPADHDDVVGGVVQASMADVSAALAIAETAATLGGDATGGAGPLSRAGGRSAGGADAVADRPRGREAGNPRQRRRRGARGGGLLPVLCGANPRRVPQRHRPAARPGRLDQPFELPARYLRRPDERGTRRRQSGHRQTGRADAADRVCGRAALPSGGRAARRPAASARTRRKSARRWSPIRASRA